MLFHSLRALSLAKRLTVGFATVLALLVAVAGVGAYSVQTLKRQVQAIVEVHNAKTGLANALLNSIDSLSIQLRSVALFANMETDLDGSQGAAEVKRAQDAQERYTRTERELTALLDATEAAPPERALLGEVRAAAQTMLPIAQDAIRQGANRETEAAIITLNDKVRPEEALLREKIQALIAMQKALTAEANARMAALAARTQGLALVLVVFAVVLGTAIGWSITGSVTQPIGRAVVVAERIAQGDLSSEVEVRIHDETGRLLEAIRTMQERLRALVGGIRQAADSIQLASSEVASGNQDLSERTEQTASNLQQTAHAMGQLTQSVQDSALAAQQAHQLASKASSAAADGGSVVTEVVRTMDDINTSSRRIADIIGVIDGIAFQTNILALNAAVEAARAGEQGRGFAVVASEVRALAARSAEAAREIKMLIQTSVERVERGARLVGEAGNAMTAIVGSVNNVNHTIGEITQASSSQSQGIGHVNSAITALDQMTQQNSALVEQSAAAAESLKDLAAQLAQAVSHFKLDRRGDAAPLPRIGR